MQVNKTPWNNDELSPETFAIADKLASLNRRGILTINSQPNVNGLPSNDEVFGWGQTGGYVYQKAYLEFFTCRKNVEILKRILPEYPLVNYHIINKNVSWRKCYGLNFIDLQTINDICLSTG